MITVSVPSFGRVCAWRTWARLKCPFTKYQQTVTLPEPLTNAGPWPCRAVFITLAKEAAPQAHGATLRVVPPTKSPGGADRAGNRMPPPRNIDTVFRTPIRIGRSHRAEEPYVGIMKNTKKHKPAARTLRPRPDSQFAGTITRMPRQSASVGGAAESSGHGGEPRRPTPCGYSHGCVDHNSQSSPPQPAQQAPGYVPKFPSYCHGI